MWVIINVRLPKACKNVHITVIANVPAYKAREPFSSGAITSWADFLI